VVTEATVEPDLGDLDLGVGAVDRLVAAPPLELVYGEAGPLSTVEVVEPGQQTVAPLVAPATGTAPLSGFPGLRASIMAESHFDVQPEGCLRIPS
jgi:hypothetical protein